MISLNVLAEELTEEIHQADVLGLVFAQPAGSDAAGVVSTDRTTQSLEGNPQVVSQALA